MLECTRVSACVGGRGDRPGGGAWGAKGRGGAKGGGGGRRGRGRGIGIDGQERDGQSSEVVGAIYRQKIDISTDT